jgi:hypothetical protein
MKVCSSTAIAVIDREENTGEIILNNRLAFLKINAINLLM